MSVRARRPGLLLRSVVAALVLLGLALTWPVAARADDAADAASRQLLVLLPLPPPHFRPDRQYSGGYADGVGRSARRAIAGELARTHGLALVTDWPLPALGVDCYVLAVPEGLAPEQVAQQLARDARVAWVQPMNLYRAQGGDAPAASSRDEPMYPLQPSAAAWRLAELHRIALGRGVRVAVIDSAVDAEHPDLAGQVARRENFVDGQPAARAERHGTAVAGVIAARADNRAGVAGVAPQARVLALRGCWQTDDERTLCTSLSLAKALQFAIDQGAVVVNLSLGGPPDRLLARLIDAALQRGIAVVAAHDAALPGGGFPASHAGVIAVASVPAAGALLAPGRDVPVPVPTARWTLASGASYAAAHVSGLFALLGELGAGRSTALVLHAGGGVDACATLRRVAGASAASAIDCEPDSMPHASARR